MSFRCKICGETFEDDGDLGMHLAWSEGLGEEINEEGSVKSREEQRQELIDAGFGGMVEEIEKKQRRGAEP